MGDLESKRVGGVPSELRCDTRAGRGSPVEMQAHGVPGRQKGEGSRHTARAGEPDTCRDGKQAYVMDSREQAGGGWQIEVREVAERDRKILILG